MYEAVHAYPDGRSTVSRLALTAGAAGYDGVVVHNAAETEYDPDAIADAYDVDVVDGYEVRADSPSSAGGYVGSYRREHTVLCVRGGTPAMNRFAAENDRVDVLTRPAGGGDHAIDDVLVRAARDHGVRIEFDLGPVLRQTGGQRVRALKRLRLLRELVETYDAPFVVSATADSHLQLRAPRELVAVGEVVGFDPETVRRGLLEWGRLAARNRERRSESFIQPGVKWGRYEEDD
jgi:ribonuclease P/MRP protein subunit RPP1